ncbi:MAG: M20/M25/M40 family metallo-hydrolase [Paracoccaceae bacterium]|jgi:glutamate carboxypeptidase|uniref:M20/M25/M40 family metallo-hydrolase n=1 Tax=Seohaeicola sp. SP36 TaxID=3028380 RepID=UPI00237B0CF7|nr:M20/M25/M40 family metallo-hydrolase [Seohaeicola sp. SP36]MDD9735925.1 M20/M25/M40 family metallo-hydrolase [Seohaeicola sp. SP36]MDM7969001.1 M20/M25/M40 family metallo-hydrolase [Paracoccaceae bacterium]
MNPLDLNFDADDMVARLRPWIECESPTYDADAVNRMMDLAAYDLTVAGAVVERIPGRMGFGGSVRARFPHPDFGKPGILIAGHMDTVHPIGTLEKLPFKREGDICYGPGIMDMKGGNFISLEAIKALAMAGMQTPLPVTVLFTPDEEVGTPSTRDLIEAEAAKNKYVLVPEPAKPDGGAVIGRYAIARFNLRTVGRPSHAGWALAEGRSAIAAMAKKILEIESMTTDDCTFSVGVIHAGQWVNCVSSSCEAQALTMAKTQEDLDRGVAAMMALQGEENGVSFEVTRGVTRPVWEPDQPGTMAMFDIAKEICADLGFTLTGSSSGGGSDGNFTGFMGIPTLDSIGVRGKGLHTLTEHIEVASLAERAKLTAALLMRLA